MKSFFKSGCSCKGLVLALGLFCVSASAVEFRGELQVRDTQYPLSSGSVQLSGYLEQNIQNSIEHWNKGVVPYPKFVEFFRTGRPQFALGEMWGKSVRSGCMFYRYTRDPELKKIMAETVRDLLSAERANGSISCMPVEMQPDSGGGDLWERKYVLLGLEEYYEQVEADPEVLACMVRQADCLISQIGEPPKTPITELGWSPNHIESSTLLEPIMRLYKLTGYPRYLEFARYIVEVGGGSKGYNLFQQALDNVPPHKMGGPYPKAYEMMSLFEGLVEYYRVTGNPRWKEAALNLYRNIRAQEITLIGNAGGDQPYHPNVYGEAWDHTAFEQTNPDITRMMETCVGVTWLKFCSQLLRLEGDCAPADDIEKYIYNGLLGAMKPTGDGFSYVNLLNGEKVTNQGWGWKFDDLTVTCCNLNGPMGLAYIPYIAVMNSAPGPVVNLYNAGKFNLQTPSGRPLKLDFVTEYPLSEKVLIHVKPGQSENFTLSLRIPTWSAKTQVSVNGRKYRPAAGEYFKLNRKWKPTDKVEITFDMKCSLIDAPRGSNPKGNDFQALTWGPLVLARDENTDPRYNQPVTVLADPAGIVKAVRTTPTLPATHIEFIIPTAQGPIRMIDYSSVNGWQGKKVCTWLPMAK